MKQYLRSGWFRRASTYLIPVIVTLFICMLFCMAAWNIAREERQQTQENTAAYFVQNLDTRLKSVKSYSYEVLNSRYMVSLSQAYAYGSQETQSRTETHLMSNIFQYCNSIKLAENILLLYPEQDTIISKYGALTSYQYFLVDNPELNEKPELYQQRYDSIFDRRSGEFFAVENPFTGAMECYYFLCSPSNTTLETCKYAMALRISPETLAEEMSDMARAMNIEFVAAVTEEGRVFAHTDMDTTATSRKWVVMGLDELADHMGGADHTVNDAPLWHMDLYFVHNDTLTYHYLKQLSTIMVSGLVLATLLGLALALLNHSMREKRMDALVDRLGGEKGTPLDSAVTEFLDHTWQENEQNILIIDRQRTLVRYSFFKELLRNDQPDQAKVDSICMIYDISFENDTFSVFAVTAEKGGALPEKNEVFAFLTAGKFTDFVVYWTRIEKIDVFLCNYNAGQDRELMSYFKGQLQAQFSGPCYGSGVQFEDAPACIQEFRRLYQVITGRRYVAYGVSVNKGQSIYQRLTEAIASEDLTRQQSLLPQVCQQLELEEDSNQNLSRRYAFLYELYNLPQFRERQHILDEMFRDMRVQTWIRCLGGLIPRQEDDKAPGQNQTRMAAEVVRIISEEYDNPQMSLSILSERLGVSQSYLSRVFKQEYGENISHYLSKTRVEHAKQMMCSGDMNLNAIALRVGFLSDMTFIRVFKKLENETPGNYRKKSKEGAAEATGQGDWNVPVDAFSESIKESI